MIHVEIAQRETADGQVVTKADVIRLKCHKDQHLTICDSYWAAKVRDVSFTYDQLLTTATARITATSGKVMQIVWTADDTIIDGATKEDHVCGPGKGTMAGLVNAARATGRLFGKHLIEEYAYLALGAESTECY